MGSSLGTTLAQGPHLRQCTGPAEMTMQTGASAPTCVAFRIGAACILLGSLAACVSSAIEPPATTASEDEQYAMVFPYYAENCALSQLGKKPGFGADISSGFGGHAALYLNRVCRRQDVDYPVLQMCDEQGGTPSADGVGLSVNAHYENATWVAVEGRDFFFRGGLKDGEALSRDTYRTVQAQAQRKRIYDGVTFHDEVYDGMPAGFTRQSFQ